MSQRTIWALKSLYYSVTTIGVLIGIVLGYNQLRIWQDSGQSHMDELLRISLILAFAVCILGGGVLHYLAWRGSKEFRQTLPEKAALDSKLKIHSALWGNTASRKSVLEVLETQPKDALTFWVSNDTFGCDPAEGDDQKYVDISYSYGDAAPVHVSRPQGTRVVLPEDSWGKKEIQRFDDLYRAQLARVEALQAKLETHTAKPPEIAEGLKDAPRLLVEYRPQEPRDPERLVFINDGPATVKNIDVGSLIWNITHTRELNLHSVVGPLRPQKQVDCYFGALERQGRDVILSDLPDMLRAMMREIGHEPQARVKVSYEDMNESCFSITFALSIDPRNRVVWDPGPVRREPDATAAP